MISINIIHLNKIAILISIVNNSFFLDSVRNYFGEKIAFYFSFLNYYCSFFLYISIACLFSHFFNHWYFISEIITVIICVSLFIFLKSWIRQSNRLACKWGTIDAFELESARPAFRSKGFIQDPITGELVPFYPITKTWLKEYLISVPFVILCLYLSFKIMCIYFEAEDQVLIYYNENPNLFRTLISYCPTIVYALIVMLMNHLYRLLVTKLNDYGK